MLFQAPESRFHYLCSQINIHHKQPRLTLQNVNFQHHKTLLYYKTCTQTGSPSPETNLTKPNPGQRAGMILLLNDSHVINIIVENKSCKEN